MRGFRGVGGGGFPRIEDDNRDEEGEASERERKDRAVGRLNNNNNNNNSINGSSREERRARARAMYTYLFTKEITRGRVSAARILILGRKTISRRNTPDRNAPFARLLTLTARR